MDNDQTAKRSPVVRIFMVLIFILAVFCCYVVGASLLELFHNPYENLSPWVNLSLWLDALLTALISLVILFQLFRLVQMVAKGDPFSPENPRRVRSVAYAVLAISVSNIAFRTLNHYSMHLEAGWWMGMNVLIKGAERAFFILGLLIVAKLLETGVRLQQDQNLTV